MAKEARLAGQSRFAPIAVVAAQRRRRLTVAAVIVGLLLAAGVLYFALGRPVQVLPRGQTVPAFDMVDQNGTAYRFPDRALPVNVYVVAAAWDTQAADAIVPLLHELDSLVAERGWQELVHVAWITPDPARDDVAAMRALAERLPLPGRLDVAMLTGAPVTTRLVVGGGFGIYVGTTQAAGGGQPGFSLDDAGVQAPAVVYEPAMVVVDEFGYVRARYGVRNLSSSRLARDLGLLVKEVQAEGASRLIYETAHLFMCYPR
ncbi:MAG TPA: hypothetical protein VIK98_07860 [Limnochordales bacterium]